MNANCFRLVFNRARGMLLAVAETAAGHGRARGAAAAPMTPPISIAPTSRPWFAARAGAFAALCAFGMQPLLAQAQATLPVTPDRNAPGAHPVVGVAANGVPVVNIVPPNGAGLSHNRFTDYNTGTAGMVLNNSGAHSATRVAGWVQGNPFIGNRPARTILNEVTSGHASRLLGMTEVAGNRANVVIANPAGLYCNGCGFINAPRATLSTGVPVLDAGGALARLDVAQGVLTVDGRGLDARANSQIDLIARAMRINGAIWAHRLEAIAGENQVAYADNSALVQAGAGGAPQVAIDVAALGGMYADTVRLVSTGQGVGVNLGGGVNSLAGDLQVSSNGDVTIAAGGSLSAVHELAVQAASIRNAGTIAARADTLLVAANTLENSGSITARGDITGTAGMLENTGTLAAGVDQDGSVSQPGSVRLAAASTLRNAGALQAGQDITLHAAQADLSNGSVRGAGAVAVSATGAFTHVNAQLAGSTVDIQAGGALDNRHGSIVGGRQVSLAAAALDNRGGAVSAQGGLALDTGEVSNAGGQLAAQQDLQVHAAHLGNQGGTLGSVAGNVSLAAGSIDNSGGTIGAARQTHIEAGSMGNRDGQIGGAAVALRTSGGLDNRHGVIAATAGDLTLAAGAVDNSAQGAISAEGSVALDVARLNNDTGVLTAQQALRVAAAGALSNRAGTLGANGAASIMADMLDNDRGLLHAGGELTLQGRRIANTHTHDGTAGIEAGQVTVRATELDNTNGAIRSDKITRIDTATLDNTGGALESSGAVDIAAAGDVINLQGDINGGTHAGLAAHGLSGTGTVQSKGDVSLALQSDFTNTGSVLAEHDVRVSTTGDLTNAGTMSAGQTLDVAAQNITNTRSGVLAGNHTTHLAAAQALDNDGLINGGATRIDAHDVHNTGRIYGDSITIGATTLVNEAKPGAGAADGAGAIASRGDMDLAVATLVNREGGYLLADNDLRIGGALDAAGHATGSAGQLTNDSATIEAGGDAVLSAARIDNLNSHFATTHSTTSDDTAHYFYALPGSSEMLPGESTWLYHANGKPYEIRNGNQDAEQSIQGDYSWYLVLPSDKYPRERYGPPFDYGGTAGNALGGGLHSGWQSNPVGLAYAPAQPFMDHDGYFHEGTPEQFGYSPEDKIWQVFGVSPPAGPLPAEPVNNCQANDGGCRSAFAAQHDAWEQARTGYIAQYQALNEAIAAFNQDFSARLVQNFDVYTITGTTTISETVTNSAPGQILAGGNLTLAGALNNDKSRIVAGRDFNGTGAQTINADALGTRTTVAHGKLQYTYKGGDREWQTLDANLEQTLASEQVHLSILPSGPGSQPVAIRTVAAASAPAQGAGGQLGIAPPQDRAVANLGGDVIRTMTPPLRLPNNALYRTQADPGSHYLVEADPAYADFRTWISSDTMIRALNQDPDKTIKRLGDGFYEQQLVAQQVLGLTGQRFTGDYTNTQDEYAALLANGAAAAQAFDLSVGTALSDAQMAALTTDIVWLVKQSVTLPDGTTQEVLAPQVYLQAKNAEVTGSGALIAGQNVALGTSGELRNSGTIAARALTVVSADTIQNVNGTLAGKTLAASAATDLNNLGGRIMADAAVLQAGRDVNLGSQAWSASGDHHAERGIGALGTVNAGSLAVAAGRDLNITAAALNTTGDMTLAAQRDVNLATLQANDRRQAVADSRNQRTTTQSAELGSELHAGGNMTLAAGQDVNATAATASADQALTIAAGRDVNLRSGQASQSVSEDHHYEAHGFLSSKQTTTEDHTASSSALGTTLAGATVDVRAGRDLSAQAATIAGSGDVNLAAGHDLTLGTAATSSSEHHFEDVQKSGLGAAGPGLSWGTGQTKDTTNDARHGAQGSLIGSTEGSVHMQAGNALHISGSDVIAQQDVTGVAADISIDASGAERHHDETHETRTSGFTLSMQAPVLDALQNVRDQAEGADASQDGRAAALHAMAAASGLWDAAGAAKGASEMLQKGEKPEAKVQLSWGTSHSKRTFSEDSTQHDGSTIQAGGTAAFVAQGNGTPGSGNLTIAGSDVNAQNVLLQAANQVNLVSSTDTDATRSQDESTSTSLGVSFGTGGWGVSAAMSRAHGDGNSDAAQQRNTHIDGAQNVAIVSGGDTNLLGAAVSGRHIATTIGGDLNIASLQDTTHSAQHQQSSGGGLSISEGGASGSFSTQHGDASGSYAGVAEQSGLHAGDGGFDIHVKGNTDLTGAYIASDADASKNQLTTGTLSFSDIQNQSSYEAKSSGIAMGTSSGNGGNNYSTHGPDSGANTGGPVPMLSQHASGSESATTQSGISAGTITITDAANQQTDLASLKRDTEHLNGTVAQTPDLRNLLDNQAGMMAAVSAAGEAMARRISDYANGKEKAAKAAGDETEAKKWAEGGTYRIAMHAAGMAVMTGMGGGDALGGAMGAAISAGSAKAMNQLAGAIADADPTGNPGMNEALGNIVASSLAGAVGEVVGGNSGAFAAANVDRYNRQLHPEEREWAKNSTKDFAAYYKQQTGQDLTLEQAQNMLQATGYRLVDAAASKGPGGDAVAVAYISKNAGSMFTATTDEYNNPLLYGNEDGSRTPEQNALPGAVPNPKLGLAIAGALAAPAILPALAAIPGAPIFSSGGALGSTAWAAPAGTGAISAGINAGAQYLQNGKVNLTDVAIAGISGSAGVYGGLLWNIGVNTAGGAAGTAINNAVYGKNDSVMFGGAVSGAGAAFGYGAGKGMETAINSSLRPTINSSGWADVGKWAGPSGSNLLIPNNLAVIGAGAAGGSGSEAASAAINGVRNQIDSIKK